MDLRNELIINTKKGLGFPIAGLFLMVFASVVVHVLPVKQAMMYVIFATGSVFPIAMGISRFLKVDPFFKLPPLSHLGAILAGVQLFYWPVFVLIYVLLPGWLPFAMAVLFGSHFIPYGWLYKSKGYYFLGILMPVVASILALVGKEFSYLYTFAAMVPLYFVTCLLLSSEVKKHDYQAAYS